MEGGSGPWGKRSLEPRTLNTVPVSMFFFPSDLKGFNKDQADEHSCILERRFLVLLYWGYLPGFANRHVNIATIRALAIYQSGSLLGTSHMWLNRICINPFRSCCLYFTDSQTWLVRGPSARGEVCILITSWSLCALSKTLPGGWSLDDSQLSQNMDHLSKLS